MTEVVFCKVCWFSICGVFSHVSIEYWNQNKAHFIFFKLVWGENFQYMQIVPSFTAVNLLLKSNQNDGLRPSTLCKHKMYVTPEAYGHDCTLSVCV